jgi:hypothetical protein
LQFAGAPWLRKGVSPADVPNYATVRPADFFTAFLWSRRTAFTAAVAQSVLYGAGSTSFMEQRRLMVFVVVVCAPMLPRSL